MYEDRLQYLVMRCVSCKDFLTRLEIVRKWELMESDESNRKIGICHCGGRQLKPTNLTPEEESLYASLWQKFRYYVLRKRDRGTRIIELYDKCVKGKDLGEEYQ